MIRTKRKSTRQIGRAAPAVVLLLALALPGLVTFPAMGQGRSGPSEFMRGEVASRPPEEGSEALREVGFDQNIGEALPLDLTFTDAEGREVVLGELFGERPVVLSMVYFNCPMLCPMTLNGLTSSLKALTYDVGEDYEVVVVSFDPREGPDLAAPAKLQAQHRYGRAGTEHGWHFLTGDAEAVERLTDAVGFRYTYDEETEQFAHAAGVVVLTPEGRIARYFFGIEYPAKDLKLGLVEAGENRLGSVVDQLLLYCFQYDPTIGEYAWSARAVTAMRVLALATLLALGTFIVVTVRRERKTGRQDRNPDHHETRTA